jgi:ribosomal protein L11 methylase PrmA
MTINTLPSSFRDPSGFIFSQDGELYRQVNSLYKADYDFFMNSGLYEELTSSSLLVEHKEVNLSPPNPEISYKVLKPEIINFISYPYEWCFSQLKDAALTTLQINEKALNCGMVLKDASAYNIQFKNAQPVFVDTLSFEIYKEGNPWIAYRQFCQHFLAPLALMSLTDIRLNQLSRVFIDGVPLDLATRLLPTKARLNPGLLMHIYLHAKSQANFADTSAHGVEKKSKNSKLSLKGMQGLIDSLRSTIQKLKWRPQDSEWGDYYSDTNYSTDAMQNKLDIVAEFLGKSSPKAVWDLGANTGVFSRLASGRGITTVSFDIDPAAVEKNYLDCVKNGTQNLLPLVLDLTNPSPSLGWQNKERDSIPERGPADAVMALALIHHLAISNNLPFQKIADFLSSISHFLIIEFVPKSDSQVQRLLSAREDIFTDYSQALFEIAFQNCFTIIDSKSVHDSKRVLYLMKKREAH